MRQLTGRVDISMTRTPVGGAALVLTSAMAMVSTLDGHASVHIH